MFDLFLFMLAGSLAGVMSGLLGIGGGMIIVPTFNIIFESHMHFPEAIVMHLASGTALCIMIFTSSTSVYAQWQVSAKARAYFKETWCFLVVGIIAGALLADILSTSVLRKIFSIFILLIAFEMQFGRYLSKKRIRVSPNVDGVIISFIGVFSGLLGIGGAVLLIPYLSRRRMTLRKITHISALMSLTAGVVGTITVMLAGLNHPHGHEPWSVGYVYLPAAIFCLIPSMLLAKFSASQAHLVPVKYLKMFFILFLVATSLRMFW